MCVSISKHSSFSNFPAPYGNGIKLRSPVFYPGERRKASWTRNNKKKKKKKASIFSRTLHFLAIRSPVIFHLFISRCYEHPPAPFCLCARGSRRCTLVWALQGSMRSQTGYFISFLTSATNDASCYVFSPPVSFTFFHSFNLYFSFLSFFSVFFRRSNFWNFSSLAYPLISLQRRASSEMLVLEMTSSSYY